MSREWQHQDPSAQRVQPLNPEARDLQLRCETIVVEVDSATTTFQKSKVTNDITHFKQLKLF
jgi:hypothetical protein